METTEIIVGRDPGDEDDGLRRMAVKMIRSRLGPEAREGAVEFCKSLVLLAIAETKR